MHREERQDVASASTTRRPYRAAVAWRRRGCGDGSRRRPDRSSRVTTRYSRSAIACRLLLGGPRADQRPQSSRLKCSTSIAVIRRQVVLGEQQRDHARLRDLVGQRACRRVPVLAAEEGEVLALGRTARSRAGTTVLGASWRRCSSHDLRRAPFRSAYDAVRHCDSSHMFHEITDPRSPRSVTIGPRRASGSLPDVDSARALSRPQSSRPSYSGKSRASRVTRARSADTSARCAGRQRGGDDVGDLGELARRRSRGWPAPGCRSAGPR